LAVFGTAGAAPGATVLLVILVGLFISISQNPFHDLNEFEKRLLGGRIACVESLILHVRFPFDTMKPAAFENAQPKISRAKALSASFFEDHQQYP
jgi:hypothetical protein